jgi:hypothetical protein
MRRAVVIYAIIFLIIAIILAIGGATLYDYCYEYYILAVRHNQLVGIPFLNIEKIDTTPLEKGMLLGKFMSIFGFISIFVSASLIAIGFVLEEDNPKYLPKK